MIAVLGVIALFGSGITAGVLFCVALSIVPTFQALAPGEYIRIHRLVGRNYDPVMPITVLSTTAACAALAVFSPATPAKAVFAATAVLLLGVSAVSHLCNVPINRSVKSLDAASVPASWADPRRRWRSWNLLRTGLAVAALLGNAAALVLVR